MKIGVQIRSLRELNNITQRELAHKIGTTQSAISRFEKSSNETISLTTLNRIAKALNAKLKVGFEEL